jgi:hypothetical protein
MKAEARFAETPEAWEEDDCALDSNWNAGVPVPPARRRSCARELPQFSPGGVVLAATFSRDVSRLISGDLDSDETGDIIATIHDDLARGNNKLLYELVAVVLGTTVEEDDLDARCLGLEILATSKITGRELLLPTLIKFALASGIDRLQFRAIGAANTLPRSLRTDLRRVVEGAVNGLPSGSAARRLGSLFIENNK